MSELKNYKQEYIYCTSVTSSPYHNAQVLLLLSAITAEVKVFIDKTHWKEDRDLDALVFGHSHQVDF